MQQTILLTTSSATPGDNYFKIRLSPSATADVEHSDPRPIRNAADLDLELRAAFQGVRMVPSNNVMQNVFGPFSYASGHGVGGESCLYAWQQIAAPDEQKAPLSSGGGIQIRFRMCDAQRSERDLLMVMYGFTIAAAINSKGWNPYGMMAQPQTTAPLSNGFALPAQTSVPLSSGSALPAQTSVPLSSGSALPAQTTVPLSNGISLPARTGTACELSATPDGRCLVPPEQEPVRLAIAEMPAAAGPLPAAEITAAQAAEALAASSPSEAGPIFASAPNVPLPPTRRFDPRGSSPISPEGPAGQTAASTLMPEPARVPVPPLKEAISTQPADSEAVVPSPSRLADTETPNAQTANAEPAGAPNQADEASRSDVAPPRVIEFSALPSSLRPNAATVEAACKADDGKVCPQ